MKCASSFISYYKHFTFSDGKNIYLFWSSVYWYYIKTIAANYFRSCFLCKGKIHNNYTKHNWWKTYVDVSFFITFGFGSKRNTIFLITYMLVVVIIQLYFCFLFSFVCMSLFSWFCMCDNRTAGIQIKDNSTVMFFCTSMLEKLGLDKYG